MKFTVFVPVGINEKLSSLLASRTELSINKLFLLLTKIDYLELAWQEKVKIEFEVTDTSINIVDLSHVFEAFKELKCDRISANVIQGNHSITYSEQSWANDKGITFACHVKELDILSIADLTILSEKIDSTLQGIKLE